MTFVSLVPNMSDKITTLLPDVKLNQKDKDTIDLNSSMIRWTIETSLLFEKFDQIKKIIKFRLFWEYNLGKILLMVLNILADKIHTITNLKNHYQYIKQLLVDNLLWDMYPVKITTFSLKTHFSL